MGLIYRIIYIIIDTPLVIGILKDLVECLFSIDRPYKTPECLLNFHNFCLLEPFPSSPYLPSPFKSLHTTWKIMEVHPTCYVPNNHEGINDLKWDVQPSVIRICVSFFCLGPIGAFAAACAWLTEFMCFKSTRLSSKNDHGLTWQNLVQDLRCTWCVSICIYI